MEWDVSISNDDTGDRIQGTEYNVKNTRDRIQTKITNPKSQTQNTIENPTPK